MNVLLKMFPRQLFTHISLELLTPNPDIREISIINKFTGSVANETCLLVCLISSFRMPSGLLAFFCLRVDHLSLLSNQGVQGVLGVFIANFSLLTFSVMLFFPVFFQWLFDYKVIYSDVHPDTICVH